VSASAGRAESSVSLAPGSARSRPRWLPTSLLDSRLACLRTSRARRLLLWGLGSIFQRQHPWRQSDFHGHSDPWHHAVRRGRRSNERQQRLQTRGFRRRVQRRRQRRVPGSSPVITQHRSKAAPAEAAPGYPTTQAEVEAVTSAVEEAAQERLWRRRRRIKLRTNGGDDHHRHGRPAFGDDHARIRDRSQFLDEPVDCRAAGDAFRDRHRHKPTWFAAHLNSVRRRPRHHRRLQWRRAQPREHLAGPRPSRRGEHDHGAAYHHPADHRPAHDHPADDCGSGGHTPTIRSRPAVWPVARLGPCGWE
jgi:hypothetical protein